MVDREDAERAVRALRMVIAGLAEQVTDMVATPDAADRPARIAALGQLQSLGRDIAVAAEAATMVLQRS